MRSLARLFARPAARSLTLACVALAAGGVLLLKSPRAPSSATSAASITAEPVVRPGASPVAVVGSSEPVVRVSEMAGVKAKLSLSQGKLQAGGVRQVFAEIDLGAARSEAVRAPVAVAVAIDVSGSMAGEKIASARRSLLALLDRMSDDDEIAVIKFESEAHLVQPLARLGQVRSSLRRTVSELDAGGGTNIAGALRLASEGLTAARPGRVRRVVLLSDGQDSSGANVAQVSRAVRLRADEGVTLSAVGIGNDFDENFLTSVADAGRGNYAFLRTGAEMEGFLTREFDQARRTVLDGAVAEVTLPSGWRAVRAYGVEQEGETGRVRVPIGSLFAGDERRVVIELSADPEAVGSSHTVLGQVSFRSMPDGQAKSLALGSIAVATVAAESDAQASIDGELQAHAVSVVAAANQRDAVTAWRQGKVAEAQKIADSNIVLLGKQNPENNPALQEQTREYARDRETFGKVAAGSESGRDYGLQANVSNWARSKR
jgi:Ca-activated chloride channel family protein